METEMADVTEGFEFVAVKQEPPEGAGAGGLDGENVTSVYENVDQQKHHNFPSNGAKQEQLILGLVPDLEWVPPCLPASDEALRDPLASEGDVEPGVTERYFDGTQFTHCSTASTETAISTKTGRGTTDREFLEYRMHKSSSHTDCNAATRESLTAMRGTVLQKFKCSSCFSPFTSKYSLINHVFTHIPDVPQPAHICRTCGEVLDNTESLIEHTTAHKRKQCESSLASVPHPAGQKIPRRPRRRVHSCTVCGKAFPTPKSLIVHMRIHSGEKPYTCEICGKAFAQGIHLHKHKLTHSDEKPHHCEFCARPFTHLESLKRHLRLHTGETPYKCDICGMSFSLLEKLKTHKQNHTGEKPYSCEICGSSFAAPNSLKAHKRKHTDEKPYSCDICGESFMWSASLKRHRQTHTGEKPYSCDSCDRDFAELNGLKRHLRTHSGERPYSCQVCAASFRHLSSLTTHMRVHTGEKPYSCSICGKCFAVSSHARRHRKIHMKGRFTE